MCRTALRRKIIIEEAREGHLGLYLAREYRKRLREIKYTRKRQPTTGE